jgi:hypothetical protein
MGPREIESEHEIELCERAPGYRVAETELSEQSPSLVNHSCIDEQLPSNTRWTGPLKWLPLLKHTLKSRGDHLDRQTKTAVQVFFRAEQWRVFCSRRPVSALFTLKWARLLSFVVGILMYELRKVVARVSVTK